MVVRIRKPWERESVQNFKLAPEGSEDGPQEAASPSHSPPAHSPSAPVPTCSLGPQIVDRESITKKLTAEETRRTRWWRASTPPARWCCM